MNIKTAFIIFCLLGVFGAIGLGGYNAYTSKKPVRVLPYYGMNRYDSIDSKGNIFKMAKPSPLPDFSFINQDKKVFDRASMRGNIYVADFFFATCTGICPNMSKNMSKLYSHFAGNPQVRFVSHTVDPEHDIPFVLAEYASRYNAKTPKWNFLTGDKKALYRLAREGYQLADPIDITVKEDFIHTQNFALTDKEGFVRGYYQGTEELEMVRLRTDIELLLAEYAYKNQ